MTYDLDLRIHPRYDQSQPLYQILCPYIKWFSQESTNGQTDTYTDRTYFIPSTADAGGNKCRIIPDSMNQASATQMDRSVPELQHYSLKPINLEDNILNKLWMSLVYIL